MKIAVLTSSRADYGIYQPLLRRLENDSYFELELIVFGTHLSRQHGYTVDQIRKDGFTITAEVESLLLGDTEEAISTAMALTSMKFAGLWNSVKDKYDLVFCLGDRYEMFAAVSSSIPYNIPFAHIHGGEKTLGAMDNTFRHCLTQMCRYHFVTTEKYAQRVKELLENEEKNNVFHVGSLSLDNLDDIELFDKNQFQKKYGIDLSNPSILFTWHPETIETTKNLDDLNQILSALDELQNYQVIITLPNADTMSDQLRQNLLAYVNKNSSRTITVNSFGTQGYFSCMQHVRFMMGNSSSGIIEAASFKKFVINIGKRQKGREFGENVLHVPADKEKILNTVELIEISDSPESDNIYWNGGASDKIIHILKNRSEL